jgi:CRISPR-associated protein Cas5t
MKAVKITAWQPIASYRKPSSLRMKETFPLPPYATVIGMVHAACGFKNYLPMKVSVQGNYGSIINDLYTKYEFVSCSPKEVDRANLIFKEKEGRIRLHAVDKQLLPGEDGDDWIKTCMNRGIGNVELLTEVHLLLHIAPDDQDLIGEIERGLTYPLRYPSLGRHEDLIRFDAVEVVHLNQEPSDRFVLNYDAYIPLSYLERCPDEAPLGTVYKLNKEFEIDPISGLRRWKQVILAKHASKNSNLDPEFEFFHDEDDFVFLA